MEKLAWLDGYSGQSTDELLELEGKYRTDSLVVAFEQAIEQKAARVSPENLTEQERVILAIEALEREVNNGGYNQFFTNSSKKFVPIIINSLKRIGCTEAAVITQDAISALGIQGPITVEAIDSAVFEEESERRDEKLNECDERYYAVAGDLSVPLLEFIKRNKDKINLKN